MEPKEAATLVSTMKAAWEREPISAERIKLYIRMLVDMPYAEAAAAVDHLIASNTYFPTVAELRRCVAERRLGLPDSAAAWELADAWSRGAALRVPCPACSSTATPGWADFQADVVCPECHGVLTVPGDEQVRLPEAVLRAAELVGGRHGIKTAAEPGIVRSQFTKAYLQFREEAIQVVQVPAALQLAAAAQRAALTAGGVDVPVLPNL